MHCNRGWLHHLAARDDQALVDLDRAISLNPKYAKAFHNRAAVREKLGDTAGALADYRRLADLGHDVSEEIGCLS